MVKISQVLSSAYVLYTLASTNLGGGQEHSPGYHEEARVSSQGEILDSDKDEGMVGIH